MLKFKLWRVCVNLKKLLGKRFFGIQNILQIISESYVKQLVGVELKIAPLTHTRTLLAFILCPYIYRGCKMAQWESVL